MKRPTKFLTISILLSFSFRVNRAKGMVARITYDMNNMMSVENNMSAMDTANSHSVIPISPDTTLCLIMETLRESVIIVAPRRKLVMMVSLKLAASTSGLGGSNGSCAPSRFPI